MNVLLGCYSYWCDTSIPVARCCSCFSRDEKWNINLVLSSVKSPSNITKDNFSSEVYEDKAGRIFFWICFCSTIAYARSLTFVRMSMLITMFSGAVVKVYLNCKLLSRIMLGYLVDKVELALLVLNLLTTPKMSMFKRILPTSTILDIYYCCEALHTNLLDLPT